MGTHIELTGMARAANLPGWVPPGALHYIAHTEKGHPIRALAREAGCHASTILRQIRKIEMRRDDPLVDAALRKLGAASAPQPEKRQPKKPAQETSLQLAVPDDARLTREAMRVLRRLREAGAVLAVAPDLDKAVVVRDMPGGAGTRTAVVDADIAQAMALKDWISPVSSGRIIRYKITTAGRGALAEFVTRFGPISEPVDGCAEAQAPFDAALKGPGCAGEGQGARSRYAIGESPLSALARRRDKKGVPFLGDALVQAGERLREDFELAQMEDGTTQNWDHFLTAGTQTGPGAGGHAAAAPAQARARVHAALQNLGPGLSDVVLRCCCYLEGLETTEKRLGWSARSGKIVLRIALIRLKRHYDETVGPGGAMIG